MVIDDCCPAKTVTITGLFSVTHPLGGVQVTELVPGFRLPMEHETGLLIIGGEQFSVVGPEAINASPPDKTSVVELTAVVKIDPFCA